MRYSLKFISLVVAPLSFSLLLLSTSAASAKWYSGFTESANAIKVENSLDKLSLEQKVGQLFIFGFSGKDNSTHLNQIIHELKPGGVIVFGRNIQSVRQMSTLNFSAQKASFASTGLPLLIALDQEGGDVTRIQFDPPLPSALALGMTGDPSISERMGYLVGSLIKSVGFNMNLAPVLDISNPEVASFIGTRSFGSDPYQVASIAAAYGQGLEMAEVLATAKHFPGHGNIVTDSHHGLPYKSTTLSQLIVSDLLPYNLFTQTINASAVMIAHIALPKIDQSRAPATFSKVIIGDLLREQMKYQGLVITDDIEMAAASGIGNFEERAVRAVQAGADMIMVAWSKKAQRKAVRAVLQAVRAGEIPLDRVDDAVRRILHAKIRVSSLEKPEEPSLEQFRRIIKSRYIGDLTDSILEKNFYLSLSRLKEDSFIWSDRPVYIFSSQKSFFDEFKKKTELSVSWIPLSKRNHGQYNSTLERASRSYGVFYVTGKTTARMANRLSTQVKRRTLLVNAATPGLITGNNGFIGVVNIFSRHPKAGSLVAENIIRKSQ